MGNSIRIARELVRIAKNIVSSSEDDGVIPEPTIDQCVDIVFDYLKKNSIEEYNAVQFNLQYISGSDIVKKNDSIRYWTGTRDALFITKFFFNEKEDQHWCITVNGCSIKQPFVLVLDENMNCIEKELIQPYRRRHH